MLLHGDAAPFPLQDSELMKFDTLGSEQGCFLWSTGSQQHKAEVRQQALKGNPGQQGGFGDLLCMPRERCRTHSLTLHRHETRGGESSNNSDWNSKQLLYEGH